MSKISNRIMKLENWGDSIYYRAACGCDSPSHDALINIRKEEDMEYIELVFFIDASPYYIYKNYSDVKGLIKNIIIAKDKILEMFLRIKHAFRILLTGETTMETTFYMYKKEHIEDFIKALEEGMEQIRSWETRRKNQS